MTDLKNHDDESAVLMSEDHTVLANSQAIAVLLALQLAHIAVLGRRVATHRLPNSVGHLLVDATKVAERRRSPGNLHQSIRSSSEIQSPR